MRVIAIVIFLIYATSLIYPNTERFIYNNELFTALGLMALIYSKYKNPKIEKELYGIYFFVFYGLFEIIISFHAISETKAYLTLRTMPVWYSIFSLALANSEAIALLAGAAATVSLRGAEFC